MFNQEIAIKEMKEEELKRLAYIRPKIRVIQTEVESLLFKASGDHKPGIVNPNPGDAKQGWFDEEDEYEEDNSMSYNLWNE